jgi:hypothetical protein
VLVGLGLGLGLGTAHAQNNTSAADAAFKQGRELYKQNKYAEACEQFEKSQQLDPANGTLFNIAQCSEKIGKLATAAASYREVIAHDTNAERKASAAERLKALTPRVPKLVVNVASPPPGIIVELDSKSSPRTIEANKPIEIDFGDYTVVVRARGYNEFMSRVKISQEAKTTPVDATLVKGASNTETAGVMKTERPQSPAGSKKKVVGIGGMAVGGAAIATGVVFGVLARGRWNDAKNVCGGTTCMTQDDLERANDLGDQARSKATLSTIFVIGGVVIAGAGANLFATAPSDVTNAPAATSSGAGVTLSGVF